jgi:hypothetical protein
LLLYLLLMSTSHFFIIYKVDTVAKYHPYILSILTPDQLSLQYKAFPSSVWAEKEMSEMLGIAFKNYPDLRRLLLDYSFKGYPMQKDFCVNITGKDKPVIMIQKRRMRIGRRLVPTRIFPQECLVSIQQGAILENSVSINGDK